jgi:hypothetical protein
VPTFRADVIYVTGQAGTFFQLHELHPQLKGPTMNVMTGDVIEIDVEGEAITALVLLATPEAVILDPCDGSMPMVFRPEHLNDARIFDGANA